jgi:hypothetical protein
MPLPRLSFPPRIFSVQRIKPHTYTLPPSHLLSRTNNFTTVFPHYLLKLPKILLGLGHRVCKWYTRGPVTKLINRYWHSGLIDKVDKCLMCSHRSVTCFQGTWWFGLWELYSMTVLTFCFSNHWSHENNLLSHVFHSSSQWQVHKTFLSIFVLPLVPYYQESMKIFYRSHPRKFEPNKDLTDNDDGK